MGTYIRGAAVVGAFLVLCLSEFVGAPALASDDDPSPDMTAAERVAAYPDETEELANRYDISEARAEAEQIDRIKVDPFIADLDPDVFTGVYFTESKDGPYTLHVVTKNGFAQTLDMPQLDALTVVYESQPYSLTDLLAIRDQVRYEPGVLWTSIKPDTGTVDIIVDSLETAARTSAVSNAIRTTLGEQATPASCNSRFDCLPPAANRAGLYAHTPSDACTRGFMAKTSGGGKRWISAGHCGDGGAPGWEDALDNFIGNTTLNTLDMFQPEVDGQRITNPDNNTPQNLVYHDDGTKNYSISGTETFAQQHMGDSVWLNGYPSVTKSETITDPNATWLLTYHGTIYNMDGKKVTCNPGGGCGMGTGSSGGPVYWSGLADGILSVSDNNTYTAWTVITEIATELSLSICITSSC